MILKDKNNQYFLKIYIAIYKKRDRILSNFFGGAV